MTAIPAKLVEALAGRYTIERVIREIVDWLDRYLGPVATRP